MKAIIYSLDIYPSVLQIDLDLELTKKKEVNFHAQDCPCSDDNPKTKPGFIVSIQQVPGVTHINMARHTLFISKGQVFKWENMIRDILFRLLAQINPQAELIMDRPPRAYFQDANKQWVYVEKNLKDVPDPFRVVKQQPPPKNPSGKDRPET